MTHLFIGIGNAGGAILNALLEYKEVRRAKPIVIKPEPEKESDKDDKMEATLKKVKGIEFAFLFSGLGDCNITLHIAETLTGLNIKIFLVGVLPANRREKREELINAYYSMEKLKEHVNSFVIVDNQRIAHLPNFEDYYPQYNRYIASCIADILIGTSRPSSLPEEMQLSMPMDAVMKASSFDNKPGYVALSRASELTKGLWGYIFPFLRHRPLDLRTLLHVSLDKLSVSDAPIGCDKGISFLRVPEYYIRSRSVDRELIEEFLLSHSKECHLAVSTTRRNVAAITNLFTYKFDQLERLREIRGLAYEKT
uniref:Tubulin-like protein CetZ n=1 Tax=Candidatus Methanophagaceae archaeon ANME-1 ERB6 TaxID=2759912 RepID=A0A7G9YY98_9EURY|nr:tubulin-like protein CetZ [Methanosarcinales archaeon ANME-1 ERB6]